MLKGEIFMRDLKFRAWDKEKKRMLLWGDWEQTQWIKDAMPVQEGDEWTERCILMQYTGLKDKNGKEIYEGDILQYENDNHVGQKETRVIWIECTARFGLQNLDTERYGESEFNMEGGHHIIIGNIYETTLPLKS